MIYSKTINLDDIADSRELKPWEKRIQRVFYKLSGLPILKRSDLLDDLSEWTIKYALELFVDRWVRILTLRQFRYHLSNAIDYFKRGFKSHDFDSCFAMEDFLWKLKRLADNLNENNLHYGDRAQAKRISITIDLIERVIEDKYLDEFESEVSEKYGDSIRYTASNKGFMGLLNEGKGPFKNNYTGSLVRNIREKWTPELDKEIYKAERSMYKKADNKRKREWKKALKIIEDEFFSWWD